MSKVEDYKSVVDSGKRQEFSTGSVRDTREGKGRYDLLPPYAIQRLAQHFENGAKKYGDRNWEKGQDLARYLDSALRHILEYLGGSRVEDHLAAGAWNVLACIETEHRILLGQLPNELNNLPPKQPDFSIPNIKITPVEGGLYMESVEGEGISIKDCTWYQSCPTCGAQKIYSHAWDTMVCPRCEMGQP